MKKIKLKQLIREVIKEEKLNLSKLSKSEIKQIEKKIRKIERDNTILFAGYTKDGLAPTFLTDKSDAEYWLRELDNGKIEIVKSTEWDETIIGKI